MRGRTRGCGRLRTGRPCALHRWSVCGQPAARPSTHPQVAPSRKALVAQQRHRRCASGVCRASDEPLPSDEQELPIFPLGIVALPAADVPIQIFEARYRVLFHTLLDGEEGVSEDLVQTEAAHRGSKRFGMCFSSGDGLAAHGTVLEIVRHQVLDDGRLLVLCKGRERFELRKIVEEKPVLRCRVALTEEDEDEEALRALAARAQELFMQLLRMSAESKKVPLDKELQEPSEFEELPPSQQSFWLVSMFLQAPEVQQRVLEMRGAAERFEYIIATLEDATKRMLAQRALQGVFSTTGGASEAEVDADEDGGVLRRGAAGGSSDVEAASASTDVQAPSSESDDASDGAGSASDREQGSARDGSDSGAAGSSEASASDAARSDGEGDGPGASSATK